MNADHEPADGTTALPERHRALLHRGSIPADDAVAVVNTVERQLARQGVSIAVAIIPFGLAFGASCASAGLHWSVAVGFSMLVFTGGSQFAAVSVLADGGTAITAVAAGLLLALRSLAYGVVMAPSITGSRAQRAFMSQLMIDESIAVASTQTDHRLRRLGYLWAGGSLFVSWNISTLLGALLLRNAEAFISRWGLDASIPAAFLALLWPRLQDRAQRRTALVGATIALATIPLLPAGLPIISAGLALLAARARGEKSDRHRVAS